MGEWVCPWTDDDILEGLRRSRAAQGLPTFETDPARLAQANALLTAGMTADEIRSTFFGAPQAEWTPEAEAS